jgi:hypothetical protein
MSQGQLPAHWGAGDCGAGLSNYRIQLTRGPRSATVPRTQPQSTADSKVSPGQSLCAVR